MTDIPFSDAFGQLYLPPYAQWGILIGIIGISLLMSYFVWRSLSHRYHWSEDSPAPFKKDSKISILNGESYGLVRTTILTVLLKGSLFVIGVFIIGALVPRTILSFCPSLSPPVAVYQFAPWQHIEAYTDYRDIYLSCLVPPFLKGANLYHLNGVPYNYPPLFMYLIAGFAYLANLVWLPAFPLVLFDLLTVIPVYLIARDFLFKGNARLAFFVSLFWAANPVNLFYNDLMWLNAAPTTFFLVLAIYLFLKQQWFASSLVLAISTGFKQITVLACPVLLVILYRSQGFSKKLVLYAATYFLSLVLISTPYIFTETQYYFWSLDFPILGIPPSAPSSKPVFSTAFSAPVRITTFLGYVSSGTAKIVSESYLYLDYFMVAGIAMLLIYMAFAPIQRFSESQENKNVVPNSNVPSSYSGSELSEKSFSPTQILGFCLAAFLIFLAVYGGGVYKYYFATITPLALPFFTKKSGVVLFEAISVLLFLAPREITPWFAVLLLAFIPGMMTNVSLRSDTAVVTNSEIPPPRRN